MRYDSYSRFLKSQMYKDCIVNEMSGKPLIDGEMQPSLKSGLALLTSSKKNDPCSEKKSDIPSASANLAAAVQLAASTGTAVFTHSSNLASPTSPIPSNGFDSGKDVDQNSPNKKEKKKTMSTILPWTKGIFFI